MILTLQKEISDLIVSNFDEGTFDSCNLIYTQFNSAINQEVKEKSLIPLVTDDYNLDNKKFYSKIIILNQMKKIF